MDKTNPDSATHDTSVSMMLIAGFIALCLFTAFILIGIF
jgi:hypothetical protein